MSIFFWHSLWGVVLHMYYVWVKYCTFTPCLSYSPFCAFLLSFFFFCELSKLSPILQKRHTEIARVQRKALVSVSSLWSWFTLLFNSLFWKQCNSWKCCTKWLAQQGAVAFYFMSWVGGVVWGFFGWVLVLVLFSVGFLFSFLKWVLECIKYGKFWNLCCIWNTSLFPEVKVHCNACGTVVLYW